MWNILAVLVAWQGVYTSEEVCKKKSSWQEALDCCTLSGDYHSALPTIRDEESLRQLMSEMERRGHKSSWLGFTREILTHWKWIDKSPGPNLHSESERCGYYNRSTDSLSPSNCGKMAHGYVCEIKVTGCEECALTGFPIRICKKIGSTCLLSFCEKKNWYNARAECRKYKGDLTILRDNNTGRKLSNSKSNCRSFWIGIRLEQWGLNGSDITPVGMWGVDEPSEFGNCAILRDKNNEHTIETASCKNRYERVCLHRKQLTTTILDRYNGTGDSKTTLSTGILRESSTLHNRERQPGRTGYTWLIIVICVLVGIAGAVCVAVLSILIVVKCKQNQSPDSSPEVSLPLLEQNPEKSDLRKKIANRILDLHSELEMWVWHDETATLLLNEIYTDLEVVQLERRESNAESYSALFRKSPEDTSPTRILLIGDAGTGKTTLCKRICLDWAKTVKSDHTDNANETVSRFEFILPIFLRHVSSDLSIGSAVKCQLNLSENDAELLDGYIEEHNDKVLIIFDGYDEFDESEAKQIGGVAKGKTILTNVFVTARAVSFGQAFKGYTGKYIKAILKGFSDKGKEKYIDRFYCKEEKASMLTASLKRKIKETEDLSYLSRFPAILLLMAVLWKEEMKLSDTLTGFYQDFIAYICDRYEIKHNKLDGITNKTGLKDIYIEGFMKIGKIAVGGLVGKVVQLSFPYSKVYQEIGEMSWNLGLFCSDKLSRGETCVSFYHKTVQEYFASYYIVNCSERERKRLLNLFYAQSGALKDTTMISKFIAGLGGREMLSIILPIIEQSPKQTAETATDFQLDYISENPNETITLPECAYVNKSLGRSFEQIARYFAMDATFLRELTLEVSAQSEISVLKHLNASKLQILTLLYVPEMPKWLDVKDADEQISGVINRFSLTSIKMRYFKTDIAQKIPAICKFLNRVQTLENLDLASTDIGDDLLSQLINILSSLSQLQSICLSHDSSSSAEPLKIMPLLDILPKMKNLTTLDISGRHVAPLTDLSVKLQNLVEVRMGNFSVENIGGGRCFIEQLKWSSNLTHLQVGIYSLGESGLTILDQNLKYLPELLYLDLTSCGCESYNVWKCFVSNLGRLCKLHTLKISKNNLGDKVIKDLCRILMDLQGVKFVDLSECGIKYKTGGSALLELIESHPRIKRMILSYNDLSSVQMELVKVSVKRKCLEYLEVDETNLDPSAVELIQNDNISQ